MSNETERYIVVGKPSPYRPEYENISVAEILIRDSRLEVVLKGGPGVSTNCSCEIWDHTVYELESLAGALRSAAAEPFPAGFEIQNEGGFFGDVFTLSLAVSIELCYSLAEPGATRARLFCSSKLLGRGRGLGIWLAISVAGAYAEVVMEPEQARDMAQWVGSQIASLVANED